jgi:hypothetical protein
MLFGGVFFLCYDVFNRQNSQFTSYEITKQLNCDKSIIYLSRAKADNYPHNILDWNLQNDIITGKELSSLEYIKFGKLLSSVLQEELSFHCFYMAHLKDPMTFKTNSEIQFDTFNTKILNE